MKKHVFLLSLAFVYLSACVGLTAQDKTLADAAAKTDDPVLVGAGDVASCDDLSGAYATAKLIEGIPGTVFLAGDLAYPDGSDENFAKCYAPTWGRFKDRTRPAPGNHEYHSDGASGYARYFGAAAGDPQKAYYSYDVGTWHVIALNSECVEVGGWTQHLLRGSGSSRILSSTRMDALWLISTSPCSAPAVLMETIHR